ncbi:MAG: hypothetical protein CMN76_13045 [Spirochaetaceae bacterium]|nr:hypothetical protein [Spirochaetaceae bacterium]
MIATLATALLAGNCMLPVASKTFLEHDPDSRAPRIEYENQGTLLLFSMIPTEDPLDIKTELEAMRARHSCRELKNIDLQYFNHSFYIVGWGKLLIRADCEK